MNLIIGTYTEHLLYTHGKADGILTAPFDAATGRIGPVTSLIDARNPSYLTISASGEHLYAVNETFSFEDHGSGGITAYARDAQTGGLTRLNTRPSLGVSPCHIAIDATGRFVLAANYGLESGSVTVYRIETDGSLGDLTDHIQHAGSGPDPIRQATSHAHMIANDPQTGDILVTDLGADAVLVYSLDETGCLTPKTTSRLDAAPGAGPRHLAFHPDGQHLFVVNELDNTVRTLRRKADSFEPVDRSSTLPPDVRRHSQAAAIRVTPSGRHVLVSNRGHDSIAVLRFNDDTSTLTLTGTTSSGGEQPRDLIVTPDGRHVICADQDSGLLVSYEFDEDTATLHPLHSAVAPTPVCLTFG